MIADGLYKDLTYKIIGALYEVHKELGSVHKENMYHEAVKIELKLQDISLYKLALLANFDTNQLGIKRRIYT